MRLKFWLSLKAKSLTPTKREQERIGFLLEGSVNDDSSFFIIFWFDVKEKLSQLLKLYSGVFIGKSKTYLKMSLWYNFSKGEVALIFHVLICTHTYIIIHAVHAVGVIKNKRYFQFTYQFLSKNNFYAIQASKNDRWMWLVYIKLKILILLWANMIWSTAIE